MWRMNIYRTKDMFSLPGTLAGLTREEKEQWLELISSNPYTRRSPKVHKALLLLLDFSLTVCLFVLILNVPSTIFQLYRDGSSLVEPVLSWDKCVLLKDHNTVTPVRLEPAALRSRVKHSTTEPLRSLRLL